MSLLGKNYDEEISRIIKQLNENTENINKLITSFNNLQTILGNLQESVLNLAKVQAQHKEIITFLLNHTMVDSEDTGGVQEDLARMLKNIKKTEEEIK